MKVSARTPEGRDVEQYGYLWVSGGTGDDFGSRENRNVTIIPDKKTYRAGETARLLIRAGAEVKSANRYGVSALSLAAINGNPAMVTVLLAAGADANAVVSRGQTVLMTAAPTIAAG